MSAAAAVGPNEGSQPRVVIYQWAGKREWNLPTIDPRCLQVHARQLIEYIICYMSQGFKLTPSLGFVEVCRYPVYCRGLQRSR